MSLDHDQWEKTKAALIRREDNDPECGVDFCENCGDCISCYGGEGCGEGGNSHWWAVSKIEDMTDDERERMAQELLAETGKLIEVKV